MSKIPQSKEELEQVLQRSFEYYESIGTKVVSNYLTDYWQRQLELRKQSFIDSNFDQDEWKMLLQCCKRIIEHSKPLYADVFERYLPTSAMYEKMKLLFNDGKEIRDIHKSRLFDINDLERNEEFKLPTFEIHSKQEHPNKQIERTLFSLFKDGQEYTAGVDIGK
mgnify:CR=1 FL=1